MGTETMWERRQEKRELRRAALRMAKEKPEMLDDIESAQIFMDLFEKEPELHADAQEFREALSDG